MDLNPPYVDCQDVPTYTIVRHVQCTIVRLVCGRINRHNNIQYIKLVTISTRHIACSACLSHRYLPLQTPAVPLCIHNNYQLTTYNLVNYIQLVLCGQNTIIHVHVIINFNYFIITLY